MDDVKAPGERSQHLNKQSASLIHPVKRCWNVLLPTAPLLYGLQDPDRSHHDSKRKSFYSPRVPILRAGLDHPAANTKQTLSALHVFVERSRTGADLKVIEHFVENMQNFPLYGGFLLVFWPLRCSGGGGVAKQSSALFCSCLKFGWEAFITPWHLFPFTVSVQQPGSRLGFCLTSRQLRGKTETRPDFHANATVERRSISARFRHLQEAVLPPSS